MYCKNCGSQIAEGTRYCPHCGFMQDNTQPSCQYQQSPYQQPVNDDSGSVGWGILGFFFPIVGLILFLVWRHDKPKSAKSAGIGALIGGILEAIPVLIILIFFIIALSLAPDISDGYYFLYNAFIGLGF